jgi:hypothetical protein
LYIILISILLVFISLLLTRTLHRMNEKIGSQLTKTHLTMSL